MAWNLGAIASSSVAKFFLSATAYLTPNGAAMSFSNSTQAGFFSHQNNPSQLFFYSTDAVTWSSYSISGLTYNFMGTAYTRPVNLVTRIGNYAYSTYMSNYDYNGQSFLCDYFTLSGNSITGSGLAFQGAKTQQSHLGIISGGMLVHTTGTNANSISYSMYALATSGANHIRSGSFNFNASYGAGSTNEVSSGALMPWYCRVGWMGGTTSRIAWAGSDSTDGYVDFTGDLATDSVSILRLSNNACYWGRHYMRSAMPYASYANTSPANPTSGMPSNNNRIGPVLSQAMDIKISADGSKARIFDSVMGVYETSDWITWKLTASVPGVNTYYVKSKIDPADSTQELFTFSDQVDTTKYYVGKRKL
jgi:hypothetical protein